MSNTITYDNIDSRINMLYDAVYNKENKMNMKSNQS